MKKACMLFGCQNFSGGTCHGCLPELDREAARPFAPGTIQHTKASQASGLDYARKLLRWVRNLAFFLFAVLFIYLAYWAPEIWVDAQAKHAQNMLEAASQTSQRCTREASL